MLEKPCNKKEEETCSSKKDRFNVLDVFDSASIGNEFSATANPTGASCQFNKLRDRGARARWHGAGASFNNQHLQENNVIRQVREFEENSIKWRALVFWLAFLTITLVVIAVFKSRCPN